MNLNVCPVPVCRREQALEAEKQLAYMEHVQAMQAGGGGMGGGMGGGADSRAETEAQAAEVEKEKEKEKEKQHKKCGGCKKPVTTDKKCRYA